MTTSIKRAASAQKAAEQPRAGMYISSLVLLKPESAKKKVAWGSA
jgi:hypothetical protein